MLFKWHSKGIQNVEFSILRCVEEAWRDEVWNASFHAQCLNC